MPAQARAHLGQANTLVAQPDREKETSVGHGEDSADTPSSVLGFGTYDRRAHPRVGVLLDGLAAHGHRVAEVNAPLGIDTDGRVQLLRQPWRLPKLAGHVLGCWAQIVRRARSTARRSEADVVLVGYLGHFDVLLARLLFPHHTLVLDHLIFAADTAADRGVRRGSVQWLLHRLDSLALRVADVVVVDTDEHEELVHRSVRKDRRDVVVVPVGATQAWFDAAESAELPGSDAPLRVVFFGTFTPLHGTTTIAAALALLGRRGVAVEAQLIGGGQDHASAVRVAGTDAPVEWTRWVAPEALPAVVASHDVCLGIVGTTPKAMRVVPNKVYQGAAAGCAVVTSDTRPQRSALGEGALLVPPGDAEALAQALQDLAADRPALARLRAASRARADARFTASAAVQPLHDRLEHRGPRSR